MLKIQWMLPQKHIQTEDTSCFFLTAGFMILYLSILRPWCSIFISLSKQTKISCWQLSSDILFVVLLRLLQIHVLNHCKDINLIKCNGEIFKVPLQTHFTVVWLKCGVSSLAEYPVFIIIDLKHMQKIKKPRKTVNWLWGKPSLVV